MLQHMFSGASKKLKGTLNWAIFWGITLVALGALMQGAGEASKPITSIIMAIGAVFLVIGGAVVSNNWGRRHMSEIGKGGRGGSASVRGSGIAIGGPGGAGGKYGIGGAGGDAVVNGNGIAVGGAGGTAGDDGVWRAPAKSGYEILQRKLGFPVDPNLRQYGRGGAMPGYEPKLAIIEQLRTSYFQIHSKQQETIFQNINAVPLDYLNDQLAARKEVWRVRIVDDEYEFFIPKISNFE